MKQNDVNTAQKTHKKKKLPESRCHHHLETERIKPDKHTHTLKDDKDKKTNQMK